MTLARKMKRAAQKKAEPKTVRIPLKPETAKLLLERNTELATVQQRAEQAVGMARQRLVDVLSAIYTENGITEATPVEITQSEPFELVLALGSK